MKIIKVPTGKIFVLDGSKGKMECLSLRDYGQKNNCKAQFLGLNSDINGVPEDLPLLPLEDKWVITISTQYGCSCRCRFCDVPKVHYSGDMTHHDMMLQVGAALQEESHVCAPSRINLHYARMGEPTFNFEVLQHARDVLKYIRAFFGNSWVCVHPVVSTMLPVHNTRLEPFLQEWAAIKNGIYAGEAGLQFSINSTDDKERDFQFRGATLSLQQISTLASRLPAPLGRKYTLNFALADGATVNARKLAAMFDPDKFIVKLTPVHATTESAKHGIRTEAGYTEYTPYKEVEEQLIEAGFDVIVFVPSYAEEAGMITCGNAVLATRQ